MLHISIEYVCSVEDASRFDVAYDDVTSFDIQCHVLTIKRKRSPGAEFYYPLNNVRRFIVTKIAEDAES